MHDHNSDDVLLDVFRQLGIDLQQPRELIFYFVFKSEEMADHACQLVSAHQFLASKVELEVPWWKRIFVKPDWSVAAKKHLPIDENVIKSITTGFQRIAVQCGGTYDGWEADVSGDQLNANQFENMGY